MRTLPSKRRTQLDQALSSILFTVVLLLLVLSLFGCASAPVEQREALPEPDYSSYKKAQPDGAIFAESGGLFWFQDRLAAQPGDALTVKLTERTQAQKSARTNTGKDQDISFSVPLLGGVSDDLGIDTEVSGSRNFSGSGDSSQSNSLQGELTVLVVERLPNGYLRVAGEKVLQLNQGREYLRLTGIVRPEDIAPDNSVLSTRIAQADISYSGQGPLAQANSMGWLARFFNSPLWPF